jgi:hypothetical protein
MMGVRAIVVLLLLALGLGAVLWFTDERPPIDKVESTAVLQGQSLRTATNIRWEWSDRAAVEIGRAPDGRFQLQEPIVDIASAAYLTQIVNAWDSAHMKRVYDDTEENRKKSGLVPPELVLQVTFPDQKPLRVEVGAPGPLGNTRFLRVHGAIWEGGDALLESMRVGLDDLRERAVWRNAFAHATEVHVDQKLASGKRETLHLKLENDKWKMLAPVQGRADPVAAQAFVTAVMSLRADHFPSGVIRFPEREPEFVVRVRGGHGEEETRLWQEQGQLFGLLPGRGKIGFTSDNQQLVSIFENAASSLRARILVPMGEASFADVVELAVDTGSDRLRLTRDSAANQEWRLVEPVDVAAAPTPCHDAAYALQQLVALEFVEDADAVRPRAEDPRYGLGPGKRLVVTVRSASDREGTILWLGSEVKRGDEVFVHACRRDEPDTVALVAKDKVDVLRRPWLDYCALRVLRLTAMPERLVLERAGTKREFAIQDGAWTLAGGGKRPEVGDLVKDELRDVVGVRAVDARGAAFDQPAWTLELTRGNKDGLAVLRVWENGSDQRLVVQAGERGPVAFELNDLLSKQLRELWQ